MRYPQGGGLTAERQRFREELRLKAAELFALGEGVKGPAAHGWEDQRWTLARVKTVIG
ncbi:hypothetical protein [Streptomyces sp. NPDC060035]|uniref:hypothetical protein n=1 Tax=Streptomyces sp. NPDC060035 TaxID=3347044 RepID=UPI0036C8E49A